MRIGKRNLLSLAGLLAAVATASAQHLHLNAGAIAPTPGAALAFIGAESFVAESGYVFQSVLRTNGPARGWYEAGLTFTALALDLSNGGPEPGHAAPGARLALVVKSLSGPPGGEWAFWESANCDDFGPAITFRLATGATNGTNRFLLSQNNGLPGEDPYGHCHGRRLTMNKPGLYTLGVQIVDVSRNGPGGGPVHPPSPIYHFHLQAGVTIARLLHTAGLATATFATRTGSRYWLESNATLDGSLPWASVSGPIPGNNRLQTLTYPAATNSQCFYRLRVTTP